MKKKFTLWAYFAVAFMLAMSSFSIANVVEAASPKAGFIFFHDEASTYDANFMRAAEQACREQGVEFVFKTAVPESEECTKIAAELVQEGCRIVFADSFGHDSYMAEAAKNSLLLILLPLPA